MNKIGIDVGGTKIEGILLDKKNQIIERTRVPTKQENGYEAILALIVKLIKDIESRSDLVIPNIKEMNRRNFGKSYQIPNGKKQYHLSN